METWAYRHIFCWLVRTIRLPILYGRLSNATIAHIDRLIKPGDIILVGNPWKLQAWLIPGPFDHGALVVDRTEKSAVIGEMTASGYGEVPFKNWLKHYTKVAVLRCATWDKEYIEKMLAFIRKLWGTPYNDQFTFGPESLYCFAMCVAADADKLMRVDTSDLLGLGREYINGDDLFNSPDVCYIYTC
jgi:hypothetical protein